MAEVDEALERERDNRGWPVSSRWLKIALTTLVAFVVLASLNAASQVGEARRSKLLLTEGEAVNATVIRHQISTLIGRANITQYWLVLSATTSTGMTGTKQVSVSSDEYYSTEDGSTRRMVVARNHPTYMVYPAEADSVRPVTFSVDRMLGSAGCASVTCWFLLVLRSWPTKASSDSGRA